MDTKRPSQNRKPAQPVPPVAAKSASRPPSKSSPVLMLSIMVVVLIVIGSFGFYFISKSFLSSSARTKTSPELAVVPTTAPSTTWKTYTNTKHGYAIDYPPEWNFRESPDTKDGAAFSNLDMSDTVSIGAGRKIGGYDDYTFAQYVKIAGKEIQNYNDLASLKKITTPEGVVGYETKWMVQPLTIMGRPPETKASESLPITYFELPGDATALIRVSLDREEDLAVYEKMLMTFKYTTPTQLQIVPTPSPLVSEQSQLEAAIKAALMAKFGSEAGELSVTASQLVGNFAKGGVSTQGGGGLWFAAKVNGVWKLVWDGNGVIFCSDLSAYPDFPSSLIPECWDEPTQKLVTR